MKLDIWQIDAFAEKPFEGNPAAVVPLPNWPDDARLQQIANENNLAETAFFVREAPGRYALRWLTPTIEVDLCGHATLASGWLIFAELAPELSTIAFETRSGTLNVRRGDDGRHTISLPSDIVEPYAAAPGFAAELGRALGTCAPVAVFAGRNLLALFEDAGAVRAIAGGSEVGRLLDPRFGLIATAPGDDGFDFISRFFAPHHGVVEDPVTGSAHAALAPFWAKRLGKTTLRARQVSPRGGNVDCTLDGDRTNLSGGCALYMRGEITI